MLWRKNEAGKGHGTKGASMVLLSKWVRLGRTHATCWARGRNRGSSRELPETRWRHMAELESESGKTEVTECIGCWIVLVLRIHC